ncbi:MAG: hypothetical protein J6W76_01515, partial [Spirochaetales bacterium]|nr:hypothetical protein [Spirochaetales bacterium]
STESKKKTIIAVMNTSQLFVIIVLIFVSAWTMISVLSGKQITIPTNNPKHEDIKINIFYFGAIVGVIIFLLTGRISIRECFQTLIGDAHLSPIGILILFLSMAYISIFLDYCGFFSFCAECAVQYAGRSQIRLFIILYATVSILTIFTSNDIIILTFTPFIYYFTSHHKINPMPYLIAEFFAANTWSMTLYIGNPTNILLSDAFSISFAEYLSVMWLPAAAAGIANFILVFVIFRKSLMTEMTQPLRNETPHLKDKHGTIVGLIILTVCIISLSMAQLLQIQTWEISFFFALLLLSFIIIRMLYNFIKCHRANKPFKNPILIHTFKKMPWNVIPFVLSLAIIVRTAAHNEITTHIGQWLAGISGSSEHLAISVFGIASTLAANLLNNIPMSVFFVSVVESVPTEITKAATYSSIIGSNLGANITPVAALAGIMWMTILKNHGIQFSFADFVRYGTIVTLFALSAA